jgi:transposase, IS30 family
MLAEQKSMRQIGEELGRDAGTISRELRRNLNSTGEYKPHLAQRYYHQRRVESKQPYRLEENAWLCRYVRNRIKRYWSPEQISGMLEKDYAKVISPVTIYSWVYRNVACSGGCYKYLRLSHRWRRGRGDHVGQASTIGDKCRIVE